jgi:2',5'-phosphodiesterase
MTIRVCSYNILSTNLCDPSWHVNCKPEYLASFYRWKIISSRLLEQMRTNTIICLQELSDYWISALLVFFSSHNYTFVYDSQFLGVGIAFPHKKYSLLGVDMIGVGQKLKEQCKTKKRPKNKSCKLSCVWNKLSSLMYYGIPFYFTSSPPDVWQTAIKKNNRLVRIILSDSDGRKFTIFNYHMPCSFDDPDVMNIHAGMLLRVVQEECVVLPYILAGDFNSIPGSSVYNMITRGFIPVMPMSSVYSTPWFEITPLKSAYYTALGTEPTFTNHSHTKISKVPFTNTIDYIFSNSGFEVKSILHTLDKVPEDTFPNAEEPSDHLLIGAEYNFVID